MYFGPWERHFIQFSPSYRRRTLNQEVLCSWYLILRVKYVYLTGACSFKAVLKSVQTRKSVWWTLRKAFYTIFSVLSETDVKPGGPVFMIFNYTGQVCLFTGESVHPRKSYKNVHSCCDLKYLVKVCNKLYKHYWIHCRCLRPYHVENTGSRPDIEVKQLRALLVLWWVTGWDNTWLGPGNFFFSGDISEMH